MKTLDSPARETDRPVVVPLSLRQLRLSEPASRLASAPRLTGAAVSLPATLTPSACIDSLNLLCSRIDSLRARAASGSEAVHWELDAHESPAATLRVLPPVHADLRSFLNALEPDPFAPLTMSYVDLPGSRLWLLAVGLVRCDSCGLEQLIARWVQALAHSTVADAEPPDLGAVHQGLERAGESTEARSARAYWNRHIDGEATPHPAGQEGGPWSGRFRPSEAARLDVGPLLKKLQDTYALSARTLLLAAWIVLVGRLTGSSKATLWVQFEGRLAPKLQKFIGRLAHSVPLTLRVPKNVTLQAWVRDVDRTMTMHERLQDSYSPDPATLGAADFQFAFREPLSAAGGARIVERVAGAEPFRLQLSADIVDDRCDIALRFDAGTVRAVQADCLVRYFGELLRAFAEPGAQLAAACASAAPALSPILNADRGPARAEWTRSDELGQMVAQGLRDCHVRVAGARDDGESFESCVVRRARAMLATGHGGRRMLALVAPTSYDTTVTVAAAMIAGMPVAFVDSRWPAARRQLAIEKVGATLVVGVPTSLADLAFDGPKFSFAQLAELAAGEESGALAPAASGVDELAYVVFSSGSTGVPKPIVISRRALQNQLRWLQDRMPLTARDVILLRTPLGFDAAVWELLHSICSGSTLVIAPHETSSDPRTIVDAIVEHSVSVVQLTPHLLRTVHEIADIRTLRSLRLVVAGGDRLPAALARTVTRDAHFSLVNAYGPSECCIQVSIADVSEAHLTPGMASASVGQPMPNSGMHILSDDLEPLLDGSIGRLFLSGTPLGFGYAGDAGGTARAFLPLPGDQEGGMRMYDSGDLALRVGGSDIEIMGRVDKQMKLNGVRVDLLSIEKCLAQVDEVADAAVIAVCDEYHAGYLTAFIATRGNAADVTKRARKHLEETLLPTSQPAHYICLAQLPLTDRGKLDTEALTNSAVAVATPPSVPPRTPLEETIASVWREVLKRDAIGVHEDFFLAGGHSLLFAQVITRLRQALSLEISLRAIFLHPTIAQLAEHVEGLQRDVSAVAPNSVPDDAR